MTMLKKNDLKLQIDVCVHSERDERKRTVTREPDSFSSSRLVNPCTKEPHSFSSFHLSSRLVKHCTKESS